MIKLLKRLPTEIINKIFSYTYSPQSPELMQNIQNFKKTFDKINCILYNFWIRDFSFPILVKTNLDKQWLVRDLFNWYPHTQPVWSTLREIKNLKLLANKREETIIRLIWGILTPNERKRFVNERTKLMVKN